MHLPVIVAAIGASSIGGSDHSVGRSDMTRTHARTHMQKCKVSV